jgi:mannose-6-phosphate isomerase-like protein (cupin superfamily)
VSDQPQIWRFDDSQFREVKPGMRRRIFNGDDMSMCFWRIDPSTPRTPYDGHPDNEQFGLIIAGRLDFRIGGEERITLGPGDIYHAPRNMPHGDSRFIADPQHGETWILDIFAPVREEYRGD